MPASTLPTRSAPTSAAFVKIPPPTRANSAIEEAPIPKVTIAAVIFSSDSWNTRSRSAYHSEISRRPSPTTVKPITEPAENATLRPLLRLCCAAHAVRSFALVAMLIPIYPERPEKKPPVMKANGTYHVSLCAAAIPQRTQNMTMKKMITVRYWRFRKAAAPVRTNREISFILSVPSSEFSTFFACT